MTDREIPAATAIPEAREEDFKVSMERYYDHLTLRPEAANSLVAAIIRLTAHYKREAEQLRRVINDQFECLPKCDSYGHEEECPNVNFTAAYEQCMKARDGYKREAERLSTCDCGKPLSIGLCSVCDNDE